MKLQSSKIGHGVFAFIMSMMTALSVQADDTEIFFGGIQDSTIKPNILFILDTSGSMNGTDDGQTDTRLDRMKDAFTTVISGLNNVNVGLMRFNNKGGPILYPVTNIDEPLSSGSTYSGEVNVRISDGDSDAEQNALGVVTLDNDTLELTTRSSSGVSATINVDVSSGNDDGHERLSNGVMYNNEGRIRIPKDGDDSNTALAAGVIFRNLGIPQNSTILDAYLRFEIESRGGRRDDSRKDMDLKIEGELGSTIADFSSSNISSRTKTTSNVIWQAVDSRRAGRSLQSPNISSVVQEMVNQTTWTDSSDGAFFLQHAHNYIADGYRNFASQNHSWRDEPRLTVAYEIPAADEVQTIGLRFADLDIPQGATITSATLDFTAAGTHSTPATYVIAAEDTDNSATFTNSTSDITGRTTTGSVSWTPSAWTSGNTYSTIDDGADLTSLVQAVVNRSGWCGGNALSLIIAGSGKRSAESYNNSASTAPQLKVTYDPDSIPTTGGCVTAEVSYQVSHSKSDAVQRGSNNMSTNDGTLNIGDNNGQSLGVRFSNVPLPKGTKISSAYLEFTARETDTNSASFTIHAEDADNPANYSNSSPNRKINSLPTIGNTVSWNSVDPWYQGTVYRSPDISSLVQDLVDRSGWNKGNAMSFFVKTSSGRRRARSYDNDSSRAPRLIINASGTSSGLEETTRDALISIINDLVAVDTTPIVDTLYEAAMYYRGEAIQWGDTRGTHVNYRDGGNNSGSRRYYRVSHEGSYTGGQLVQPTGCSDANLDDTDCVGEYISGSPVYKSPIEHECQPNHIVLLTDGEPRANSSKDLVKALTGDTSCVTSGEGGCGEELTEFLYTRNPYKITTHTIGFNNDDPYLKGVASEESMYHTADSTDDLVTVLDDIATTTLNVDTTFVSPGVTVNAFNRLTHRNEIFFSLFQPKEESYWPGNLKKYKITGDGVIVGQDGAAALDPDTGSFKESTQSYWSSGEDGNKTPEGGAAEQLPSYPNRKLYTYFDGSSSKNLTDSDNAISWANKDNITKSRLGIESESDSYHRNLIDWVRGKDIKDVDGDSVADEDRNQLSDPLHSSPQLVIYGGSDENPDITIYYGDNEGFLHAVDSSTGEELFAFAPSEMLHNFNKVFVNSVAENHPYGMDGQIVAWSKDVDADSKIEPGDGDHVYIYAGMRRGGRNYYALDVTDRSSPKMLWTIEGGSGDYSDLGQTWARPIKTKISVDSTEREVLIISGGYDPAQDDAATRTADSMGNAIFIVDATDGSLIWSAGGNNSHDLTLSDMDYSIPATVRAIDVNADGYADQIYAADTGGQIWRFDITNGNPVGSLITGGRIADLAENTAATARRFYHEPDLSVVTRNGVRQLALAIGSGYQAHPLNATIEDRFFVLFLSDVYNAPADTDLDGTPDYTTITAADLFDTTDNKIENGTAGQIAVAQTALAAAKGWYIDLEGELTGGGKDPGEKVLSRAMTYDGVLYFTSYQPSASVGVDCTVSPGQSKLYTVNVANATPASIDKGENTDTSDRFASLLTEGLPPDPVHLRISDKDENGNPTKPQDIVCTGIECTKMQATDIVTKTYWYSE